MCVFLWRVLIAHVNHCSAEVTECGFRKLPWTFIRSESTNPPDPEEEEEPRTQPNPARPGWLNQSRGVKYFCLETSNEQPARAGAGGAAGCGCGEGRVCVSGRKRL